MPPKGLKERLIEARAKKGSDDLDISQKLIEKISEEPKGDPQSNVTPLPVRKTEDKTEDKTKDITPDISGDKPRIYPESIRRQSADISPVSSAVLSGDKTEDKTQDISGDKAEDTTQDISGDTTGDISPDKTEDIFIKLTTRESQLYKYLEPFGKGFTTAKNLKTTTGISKDYIIKLMTSLHIKGAITRKKINKGRRGMEFIINPNIKIIHPDQDIPVLPLSGVISYNISADKTEDKAGDISADITPDKTEDNIRSQNSSYNSSSSLLKTTTITRDMELKFWNEQGTSTKQIESWMNEFDVSQETILMQLKWCAWDIKNKIRIPKKTAQDLFFGFMKKSDGNYPKPQGYKSRKELMYEQDQKILREKEELLKKLEATRERRQEVEFKIWKEQLPQDELKKIIQASDLPAGQKRKIAGDIKPDGVIDNYLKKYYAELE